MYTAVSGPSSGAQLSLSFFRLTDAWCEATQSAPFEGPGSFQPPPLLSVQRPSGLQSIPFTVLYPSVHSNALIITPLIVLLNLTSRVLVCLSICPLGYLALCMSAYLSGSHDFKSFHFTPFLCVCLTVPLSIYISLLSGCGPLLLRCLVLFSLYFPSMICPYSCIPFRVQSS